MTVQIYGEDVPDDDIRDKSCVRNPERPGFLSRRTGSALPVRQPPGSTPECTRWGMHGDQTIQIPGDGPDMR